MMSIEEFAAQMKWDFFSAYNFLLNQCRRGFLRIGGYMDNKPFFEKIVQEESKNG